MLRVLGVKEMSVDVSKMPEKPFTRAILKEQEIRKCSHYLSTTINRILEFIPIEDRDNSTATLNEIMNSLIKNYASEFYKYLETPALCNSLPEKEGLSVL